MAVLKGISGTEYGRMYPVQEPACRLGRDQVCQIREPFTDVTVVSRQHAEILKTGDHFSVKDLNSHNGTWLNGDRITQAVKLHDGDHLTIGGLVFAFHESELARQTAVGSDATRLTQFLDAEDSSKIASRIDIVESSHHTTSSANVRLQALVGMLSKLGGSLEFNEALHEVLQAVLSIFKQADRGFIGLKHSDGEPPVAAAVLHRRQGQRGRVRVCRAIANEVMEKKAAIRSEDAKKDVRFDGSTSVVESPIRSVMCVPLLGSDGSALGILQVDTVDKKRHFRHEDLELLVAVSGVVSVAVQYSKLHEQVLKQEALERDLAVARGIQESLLPRRKPNIEGYEFCEFYRAAYDVGGDYYDYLMLPDGRCAVVVADAVGKGISAAMLITIVSGELKSSLASGATPSRALSSVNVRLLDSDCGTNFVTLVMVIVDPRSNEVTILNAGHLDPILRRRNGDIEIPGEESKGFPLGVEAATTYGLSTLRIESGESLTMFSDGFTDATTHDKQLYGLSRMKQAVASADGTGASQLVQHVVEDVQRFVGGHRQYDDMCLMCVHRC